MNRKYAIQKVSGRYVHSIQAVVGR